MIAIFCKEQNFKSKNNSKTTVIMNGTMRSPSSCIFSQRIFSKLLTFFGDYFVLPWKEKKINTLLKII